MGVFAPLLVLFLVVGFPSEISAEIDRTLWFHVCGRTAVGSRQDAACPLRKEAMDQVARIQSQADKTIPPKEADPKITDCQGYGWYKKNRTNERFKERVEQSIGEDLRSFVRRLQKLMDEMMSHDIKAHSIFEKLEQWKACDAVVCDAKAKVVHDDFDILNNSASNSSLQLRNVKERIYHLRNRHNITSNAVEHVRILREAVAQAYSILRDGDFVLDEWEDKCEEHFGEKWHDQVLSTALSNNLNSESESLYNTINQIEAIDQRTDQYLTLLEEFRQCEEDKGLYHLDCAEIRIVADEMDPLEMNNEQVEVRNPKPLSFHLTHSLTGRIDELVCEMKTVVSDCELYSTTCTFSEEITAENVEAEKLEKHRRMMRYFGPNAPRGAFGYSNETQILIANFLKDLQTAISIVHDELFKGVSTVLRALNSEKSCKEILGKFGISTDQAKAKEDTINNFNQADKITRDMMAFGARFEKFATDLNKCMQKNTKNCDQSRIQKLKQDLEAGIPTNITAKPTRIKSQRIGLWVGDYYISPFVRQMFQATVRKYSNMLWDGVTTAVELWRDTPIVQHGWLFPVPYIPLPHMVIYELMRKAECKKVLEDERKNAAPELENFHKHLNQTHEQFTKVNEMLQKEHEIEMEWLRISVCNDQYESLEDCRHMAENLKKHFKPAQ